MSVQVIVKDGAPEYAVLAWDEYQALLRAAQANRAATAPADSAATELPALARLKDLREQQGFSQEQLARAVGISPAYLAMIENAEREPDTAIRRGLAVALGQQGWSDVP